MPPHHSKRLGKISRIFWSNILALFNSDVSPLSSVNLLILRQSFSAASMDIRLRPLSKVEQIVEGSINGLKLSSFCKIQKWLHVLVLSRIECHLETQNLQHTMSSLIIYPWSDRLSEGQGLPNYTNFLVNQGLNCAHLILLDPGTPASPLSPFGPLGSGSPYFSQPFVDLPTGHGLL